MKRRMSPRQAAAARRRAPPSGWRIAAARVVQSILAQYGREDPQRLRRALRAGYPFGERRYWPYKVWLDEIRIQVGRKGPPGDPFTRDLFDEYPA